MNNNNFIDAHSGTVIKQFEKQCDILNEKYKADIDPSYYILQFNNFSKAINYFATLQEDLYMTLKTKFPNLDFGIRGRTKTAFSYFTKVLEKLKQNPFEIAEVQDLFANKIFLRSLIYPIDEVLAFYDGSFSIHSGFDEIHLVKGDAFVFDNTSQNPNHINTIVLKNIRRQILKKDSDVFIRDLDTGIIRNIRTSALQRSNEATLSPILYDLEEVAYNFYCSKGFELCKRKDHISIPKISGYSALHDSFYSPEYDLNIETQFKTADMEKASKEDPKQARNTYKKGSREINENTLYQVPHYVLTTGVYNKEKDETVPITYIPDDSECLEYTFHITMNDYLKEMALQSKIKKMQKKLKFTTSEAERLKLQLDIEDLKSKSINNDTLEGASR